MRVWFGSDSDKGLGVLSITAGAGIKQDPCRTLPRDAIFFSWPRI